VGTPSAIHEGLQARTGTQRVLEELRILQDPAPARRRERVEDVLSIDRIRDALRSSVSSTPPCSTALHRRGLGHHIETRDTEVVIKYASTACCSRHEADGKGNHSTIISRIRSWRAGHREKRIPRTAASGSGRGVRDFAFIMPSVHGEDAVIRILDRRASPSSSPRWAGLLAFDEKELTRFRVHPRAVRDGAGDGAHRLRKTNGDALRRLSEIKRREDKIITIEDQSSTSSRASPRSR